MTSKPSVRVVIVENDPSVLKDVLLQMKTVPGFIVVETCSSVEDAIGVIPMRKPDMLLLDIQLGDGTAFDILSRLPNLHFKVVFLTAYHEHAVKAIKYGALDYLLKPLNREELNIALDKVCQALPARPEQLSVASSHFMHDNVERIVVHSQKFIEIIRLAEIIYCQGSDGYTNFFLTENRKIISSKHLKEYEDLLPMGQFLRVHQSYLVNSEFISRYRKAGLLILKDGIEIPVALRRRESLLNFLSGKT